MTEGYYLDYCKSIQDLEGDDWGEPNFDSSLVETCNRLRKKPLKDFTTEDLRVMIGQSTGLKYLVPMAIEVLGTNIFAAGDLYAGDLLESIFKVKPQFWRENSSLKIQIENIIARNLESLANTFDNFKNL